MADYDRDRRRNRPSENTYDNYHRRGSSDNPYTGGYEDMNRGYSSYGSGDEYRRRQHWGGDRRPAYGDEYQGNFSGSNYDRDYDFGLNRRGYGSGYGQYGNQVYRDYREAPYTLGVGSNYAYNPYGYGSNYGGEYGRNRVDYGGGYSGEFGAASYARGRGQAYDPDREYSSYRGRYDQDYERRWRHDNRDWMDRAGDEVASWFGDEDAERRRRLDKMRDHRGRGPRSYRRSDTRIEEDINDRLSDDGWVDASDVEIKVNNGEVTLSGNVPDRMSKRRAEDIAESVSGVQNVENRIRVSQEYLSQAASSARTKSSGTNGSAASSDGDRTRSRTTI